MYDWYRMFPSHIHHKNRCSHVFVDPQIHVPSQGTGFVMNFEVRYGGNRTHAGTNPDLIRSQTSTTRPTVYIRLVPNVPITCRVCVGAFTCPCSPGVLAWHCITRTAESDRPRVRDPHEQDSESRTRDLHVNRRCGYAVYTTMRDAPTCSQTRRLTSPLRGLNL